MSKRPIQEASLNDRVARRAAELIEQADGLPEGSKERRRLERRAELAKQGLANPLAPTEGLAVKWTQAR